MRFIANRHRVPLPSTRRLADARLRRVTGDAASVAWSVALFAAAAAVLVHVTGRALAGSVLTSIAIGLGVAAFVSAVVGIVLSITRARNPCTQFVIALAEPDITQSVVEFALEHGYGQPDVCVRPLVDDDPLNSGFTGIRLRPSLAYPRRYLRSASARLAWAARSASSLTGALDFEATCTTW